MIFLGSENIPTSPREKWRRKHKKNKLQILILIIFLIFYVYPSIKSFLS